MSLSNSAKFKILVVEDDAFMQSVLKQYLSVHYEIQACGNGIEAIALLQGNADSLARFDYL
jgi:CheY-like chemotaxis protein